MIFLPPEKSIFYSQRAVFFFYFPHLHFFPSTFHFPKLPFQYCRGFKNEVMGGSGLLKTSTGGRGQIGTLSWVPCSIYC
jgi:hypothetical protein